MFCIYSPLFVAVLEGLNIARGGNTERITTKERREKKQQPNSLQESLAFITAHQNVCVSICTSEMVRVACVPIRTYTTPFAIPVISADNPPDAPVSLHII